MVQEFISTWRFWVFWGIAFVGFPIGGLVANRIVGAVSNPVSAILAGAITGAVVGGAQWLVLKSQMPLSPLYILATSVGMSLGLGISVALFGNETNGNELFVRAFITGLGIAIAQGIVLWQVVPNSSVWVVVVALSWVIGWFIIRSANNSM